MAAERAVERLAAQLNLPRPAKESALSLLEHGHDRPFTKRTDVEGGAALLAAARLDRRPLATEEVAQTVVEDPHKVQRAARKVLQGQPEPQGLPRLNLPAFIDRALGGESDGERRGRGEAKRLLELTTSLGIQESLATALACVNIAGRAVGQSASVEEGMDLMHVEGIPLHSREKEVRGALAGLCERMPSIFPPRIASSPSLVHHHLRFLLAAFEHGALDIPAGGACVEEEEPDGPV